MGAAGLTSPLRLGSDGTNSYAFGTVTVENSATLEIDGKRTMNSNNGGAATISASSMTVAGTLSANGLGFGGADASCTTTGDGPGPGVSGGGGGHGGGGNAGGSTGGSPYGSVTNPVSFGSGSGTLGCNTGYNGGAVMLNISGALTVSGTISANGTNSGASGIGAGAGGTVNIATSTISGSGIVSANGGNGNGTGGAGSGGRVRAVLTSSASFGSVNFRAYGGTTNPGAAGTVYLEDAVDGAAGGELIINNNGVSATPTTKLTPSVTDTAVGDVTIQNAGKLEIADAGVTLTVSGNWTNTATQTLTNGTVVFDNAAKVSLLTYSAPVTFYNVTIATSSKELRLDNVHQTNITGTLTIDGWFCGMPIRLRSDAASSQFELNATGSKSVQYADIKDSNAIAAVTATNSVSSGNNTNWTITSGECPSAIVRGGTDLRGGSQVGP